MTFLNMIKLSYARCAYSRGGILHGLVLRKTHILFPEFDLPSPKISTRLSNEHFNNRLVKSGQLPNSSQFLPPNWLNFRNWTFDISRRRGFGWKVPTIFRFSGSSNSGESKDCVASFDFHFEKRVRFCSREGVFHPVQTAPRTFQ